MPPAADLTADLVLGILADGWLKRDEHRAVLRARGTGTKGEPQERKRREPVGEPAVAVLAVHHFRLVGMQPQPDLFHPVPDRGHQISGLALGHTMHDDIVGITLKPNRRVLPDHPHVERVMHEQVGQDGRNHAPNEVGNFCFEVTLGYRRLEKPRRAGDDWRQVR